MLKLSDLLAVLDRWDLWQRVSASPDRLDDVEQRLADLEEKLGGKWPPDVCRFCGEREVRLNHVAGPGDHGTMREEWVCGACGEADKRLVKAR